ncbi:MAG: dTDP-4-dehydrorhamnose reductase [Kineosporiaceae bacterium]|nr:dTDP-4-dehydrorhamnose reductase [Kineosporiaceae bacterium]MBK7623723.1 dTDP-4-dehydrorhamnose reductase [Kineosporiaceae bacterium]
MTRWLVTGAGGMLGHDLLVLLGDDANATVTALTRAELDITDLVAVTKAVEGHDVVVNCAAWTAVDDAESREAEAFAANAIGPAHLARAAARSAARLLHISTDYVFAGDADRPYAEDAPIAPRTAYGRTKAAGEWAVRAELPERHWILRTAWLYGENGPNFVRTMAQLERSRPTVDVVDDQHGQPTWSRDLAQRIIDVVQCNAPVGTYHATSAGAGTWYDLARTVFAGVGANPARVRSTTSRDFVRPAPRPAWSVLGHDSWVRAGLPPMRDWREAVAEAMSTTRITAM